MEVTQQEKSPKISAPPESKRLLGPGDMAPDFKLPVGPEKKVSLSDFRGSPLIIVFYPADWSPVCGDQLGVYNEVYDEFRKYGASLIAISVDGIWSHLAFAAERKFRFPLLSDFEPKGAVSKAFGAYEYDQGFGSRALFVLDSQGMIHWSYRSPVKVNPGADGILDALEALPKEQPRAENLQ